MPFEIAPTKLSPAEQLAALIEAGRAAHPEMRHNHRGWGDGETSGCAMTFAGLALGIPADDIGSRAIAEAMGVEDVDSFCTLAARVMYANDRMGLSLEEITNRLRTGALPDEPGIAEYGSSIFAPPYKSSLFSELLKTYSKVCVDPAAKDGGLSVVFYGDYVSFDSSVWVSEPKAPKVTQPAKKVRKSAKTGATWPVAKGCYA